MPSHHELTSCRALAIMARCCDLLSPASCMAQLDALLLKDKASWAGEILTGWLQVLCDPRLDCARVILAWTCVILV